MGGLRDRAESKRERKNKDKEKRRDRMGGKGRRGKRNEIRGAKEQKKHDKVDLVPASKSLFIKMQLLNPICCEFSSEILV